MSGPSWLMDSSRIATKIKNASGSLELREMKLKSNPTRTCPRCNHIIDNSDVFQEWPGLPRGVKFDPSDPELLWHLLAKVGDGSEKPHPFIDEFIPTLEGDDGICYTHPQKLPGIKQDGSVAHFFHQTFKAYNRGTRKRRKINDNLGDVRWHKTGKTKPVILDGSQRGCKKIMVLYVSTNKGAKPEKTNWVMHQYHLGKEEDEKDGEYVVSKVFYQQQSKQNDKAEEEEAFLQTPNTSNRENATAINLELVTPQPPTEKRHHSLDDEHTTDMIATDDKFEIKADNISDDGEEKHVDNDIIVDDGEKHADNDIVDGENHVDNNTIVDDGEKHVDNDNHSTEDSKWWEGESQFLLDSQQLAEGIALCAEFLHSQSSCGGEEVNKNRSRLADYASLGAECLKSDLEECQKLTSIDNPEIVLDTPPDLRLSQLEFGSQDSILAWAEKIADAADN